MRRRILVVDDHPAYLALASDLLVAEGYDVVGTASTASGAATAVRELDPTLVLLDIHLATEDGLEVAQQLISTHPEIQVIVISSHPRESVSPRLARSGVLGFISKEDLSHSVIESLLR